MTYFNSLVCKKTIWNLRHLCTIYLILDSIYAIMWLLNQSIHSGETHLMYNIEFYEDANGRSELWNFLEELRLRAATNKDARIQFKQISLYIQLLEDNGTRLNENITKHLDDNIWELRPGNNRVLYFYFKDDTFVLLHQFRKKTQKTPKREIERAKAERDDYLSRKEAD